MKFLGKPLAGLIASFFLGASLLVADITVAAAASYKNALTEIARAYDDGKVETVFAASGKLTQQIQEGAPFDIFMSADMKYPLEVEKLGLAEGAVVKSVGNKLILWSRSTDVANGLAVLNDKKVKHIALANPKTAPLGVAAMEVLQNGGALKKVEKKLVLGENISAATTLVETGAADVGITGFSVVADKIAKGEGKYAYIDAKLYSPLVYGSVVLKNSKNKEEARKFMEFLRGEKAKEIFAKHGLNVTQ
ncbi:MAG: molybdate ABC transporter substrate-binding protein [Helicobacteraceae bacterium]|jgi:molybdate transport system substrate-binding protein|nr:molybdate ABC transporter substrate-binding protein [Helicobacteraceae bacterium]